MLELNEKKSTATGKEDYFFVCLSFWSEKSSQASFQFDQKFYKSGWATAIWGKEILFQIKQCHFCIKPVSKCTYRDIDTAGFPVNT